MSAPEKGGSEATSLVSLPAETQLNILCQVDNFLSLYALIGASGDFNALFLKYKSSILTSVVKKTLSPNMMYHANRIYALENEDGKEEGEHIRFLGTYRTNVPAEYPLPNTPALDECAKLQHSIEDRVTRLCDRWMQHLPALDLHTYPLTDEESSRLQGAFYRLTLFQLIGEKAGWFGRRTSSTRFLDYQKRYSLWEIEELLTIHCSLPEFDKDDFSQFTYAWYDLARR
jgi:hypothetical protein